MLTVYLNDDFFKNTGRQLEGQMKNSTPFRYTTPTDAYIHTHIRQSLIVGFPLNSQKINVIYIHVKDGLSADVFVCE